MPVHFSIKNVPDEIAQRLRERAARAHRSLQGELLAILTEAAGREERLTAAQVLDRVRAMRLRTPAEAVTMVREDRDRH